MFSHHVLAAFPSFVGYQPRRDTRQVPLADRRWVAYDTGLEHSARKTPPMSKSSAFCKALLPLFFFIFAGPECVFAGGGPENVLLVVNPKSPASLCIANHYAKLRRIPDDNLLFLPWNPAAQSTKDEVFRKEILLPILRAINDRGLGSQIDQVVYSSDFPWAISLRTDVKKLADEMKRATALREGRPESPPADKNSEKPVEMPPHLAAVGSITGLTYLWQATIGGRLAYFDLQGNHYMRLPITGQQYVQSAGFRGNRLYNKKGEVVASGGDRYFLSTMLGVTAGRGNTVPEVLDYLRRSDAADGTHPKGTIYFVQNGNIRSKTRDTVFPAAELELKKLGIRAEIIKGTVPLNKDDVQGVVMGTAEFDWKASGSTILRGAICDNLTSYGGVMASEASQTPLSEFLRYGAAGASGTVVEPTALAVKFPSPMIQVHYARGCTMAEAFYQSVHGPYQLLIVGDPLCRPWADIPRVSVAGVKDGATVKGRLTLEPSVTSTGKATANRFELFVDGVRTAKCSPGGTLALNTATLADGYHELRVVGIGPSPIESQGRKIIAVRTANHGRKIEASLAGSGSRRADQPLTITVNSPDSIGIVATRGNNARGNNILGRVKSEKGKIVIPANTLGAGPVRIRVMGLGKGDATTNVMADPLEFTLK